MFSIHIVFSDGSNPYVRYNMDRREFRDEITRWSRHYHLDKLITHDGVIFYQATERIPVLGVDYGEVTSG